MARIPIEVADGRLATGGVVSYPTSSPLANAVGQTASVLSSYGEQMQQRDRFNALQEFARFSATMDKTAADALNDAAPDGVGYTGDMIKRYEEGAKSFISSLPASVRSEFEQRALTLRVQNETAWAKIEDAKTKTFQTSSINKRVEESAVGIYERGPEGLEIYQRNIDEVIGASKLSQADKEKLKETSRRTLQKAAAREVLVREPAPDVNMDARSGKVMQFFISKGYTKEQAAGIVGNLVQESGVRSTGVVGDSGTAFGIAQWRGDRLERLKAYAKATGKSWEDFDTQLAFIDHELNTTEGKAGAKLKAAKTAEEAAAAFIGFERPKGWTDETPTSGHGWSRRVRAAVKAAGGDPSNIPDDPLSGDPRFANLTYEDRITLAADATRIRKADETVQAAAAKADHDKRMNDLQIGVIDGTVGLAEIQGAREAGWLKDADDINKLIGAIEKRDKEVAATGDALRKFGDSTYTFSPFDPEDKKAASAAYKAAGGTLQAVENIATRANMVPVEAVRDLRGAIVSPDRRRAAGALTVAANLLARNPNIFAGAEGGEDVERAAVAFSHYVEHWGMTADEAAAKYAATESPEYKAKIAGRVKGEDVDKIVRDAIKVTDVASAFDEAPLRFWSSPQAGANAEARMSLVDDYREIVRDEYLQSGDIGIAKANALKRLRKTWGVSYVNGSAEGVLMRFPPDRSPVMAGVPDPGEEVARQAAEDIKTLTGEDVKRDQIIISPLPYGRTSQPYTAGQPAPYLLQWRDSKGLLQRLQQGKEWMIDGGAVKARAAAEAERLSAERAAAFEKGRSAPSVTVNTPQGTIVLPDTPAAARRKTNYESVWGRQ